jgi:hypothetical protein
MIGVQSSVKATLEDALLNTENRKKGSSVSDGSESRSTDSAMVNQALAKAPFNKICIIANFIMNSGLT